MNSLQKGQNSFRTDMRQKLKRVLVGLGKGFEKGRESVFAGSYTFSTHSGIEKEGLFGLGACRKVSDNDVPLVNAGCINLIKMNRNGSNVFGGSQGFVETERVM